jgi:hypothetical protein
MHNTRTEKSQPNTTTVANISLFFVTVLSTLFSISMWTIQHLIPCEVALVLPRIALLQSPATMHCSQHHKNSKQSTFNTLKIMTDYQRDQQRGHLSLLSLPTNSKAICVHNLFPTLTVILATIGTGASAYCLYFNMSSFSGGTFYCLSILLLPMRILSGPSISFTP